MSGAPARNWDRQHAKMSAEQQEDGGKAIRLRPLQGCGHMPEGPPPLSNPRRWWCCREWRQMR